MCLTNWIVCREWGDKLRRKLGGRIRDRGVVMGEKLVAEKEVITLLISGAFPRLRKLYFKDGTMSKYCKR